jgi:Transposase DDE domain
MHVARIVTRRNGREYVSHLVRQSYREDGKVKHRTLANLSSLPQAAVDAVAGILSGANIGNLDQALAIERSLPHGHVVAVLGTLRRLGLERMLDRTPSRQRDLCVGMVVARVLGLGTKLATTRSWTESTLAATLGVEDATVDELYGAMDWFVKRQPSIEKQLAKQHLTNGVLVLYDLSSSYMEGRHCALAKRGYSRDGKRGTLQIEYGVVTDCEGRPIAVEVFAGNTSDPATVATQVKKIKERFGLTDVVFVGDRGMLTSARIDALKKVGGIQWVSSLRSPQIRALMEAGAIQMSLFDERSLVAITHPDYPGERLMVCRNPRLAEERARKREDLLCATEAKLAPIVASVEAERLEGKAKIGLKVGAVINKHKMAKHFDLEITDTRLVVTRKQDEITTEAALDGLYVIRTSVDAERLTDNDVVRTYKRLAQVERVFRGFKSSDIEVRPVHHRADDRVRAHVLLCMLAYYVQWHLERAWAPLLFRDEDRPENEDPVAPARRSGTAMTKVFTQEHGDGSPVHSLRTLLGAMATLTKNRVHPAAAGSAATFDMTSTPTALQAQALSLLGLSLSAM